MDNFGPKTIMSVDDSQSSKADSVSQSQEARKQEGKAAGATGWIGKPFSPAQLLAVLKKVLG
jgi:CheY-like chemotaxis protein